MAHIALTCSAVYCDFVAHPVMASIGEDMTGLDIDSVGDDMMTSLDLDEEAF